MTILEWLRHPWPWYVAGPLIGLTVPVLLIMGNKTLGVSSSLRHIIAALGQSPKIAHRGKPPMTGLRPERPWRSLYAACTVSLPGKIPFFQYDWKKEAWNLFFVAGILAGGWLAVTILHNPDPVKIDPALVNELKGYGVQDFGGLLPAGLFSWSALFTVRGFLLMVVGGFLVGFGTRYAGGCTSGHAIMGLSTLQGPSLVATCCFMAGGFLTANLILPLIIRL